MKSVWGGVSGRSVFSLTVPLINYNITRHKKKSKNKFYEMNANTWMLADQKLVRCKQAFVSKRN